MLLLIETTLDFGTVPKALIDPVLDRIWDNRVRQFHIFFSAHRPKSIADHIYVAHIYLITQCLELPQFTITNFCNMGTPLRILNPSVFLALLVPLLFLPSVSRSRSHQQRHVYLPAIYTKTNIPTTTPHLLSILSVSSPSSSCYRVKPWYGYSFVHNSSPQSNTVNNARTLSFALPVPPQSLPHQRNPTSPLSRLDSSSVYNNQSLTHFYGLPTVSYTISARPDKWHSFYYASGITTLSMVQQNSISPSLADEEEAMKRYKVPPSMAKLLKSFNQLPNDVNTR